VTAARMADAESISLEETNRIRISLGLKPLQPLSDADPEAAGADGDSAPTAADDEERKAVDNLRALRAEQAKAKEEETLRNRLRKAKDRKTLNEQLVGRTLADVEEDGPQDLKAWIKRSKKQERELAAKRAAELEQQDKEFQSEYTSGTKQTRRSGADYGPADLEGLKVGHDIDDIQVGEGTILTLKDRGILDGDDDEGDELISTALVEKERLQENLNNKARKPRYDPYADEYDESREKKILRQYDEEEQKTFTLSKDLKHKSASSQSASKNFASISFDYERKACKHISLANVAAGPREIASDYDDPSAIKIKKHKKKKERKTVRATALLGDDEPLVPQVEDAVVEEQQLPTLTASKRKAVEDTGFRDDEELQELLARRRHEALKKRKILRPQDIVRDIRQSMEEDSGEAAQVGGLVIDDTSEFVRGIEMPQAQPRTGSPTELDQRMEVDEEPEDEQPAIEMEVDDVPPPQDPSQASETGILGEDDEIIPDSLAATLAALKRSGELESDTTSAFTTTDLTRREEILSRQARRAVSTAEEARRRREAETNDSRYARLSQREREAHREQENLRRERREAEARNLEFADGFKFNVELSYLDEFGHEMTKKDAFKRLSHTFHGKAFGTMKRGKYLQKTLDKEKATGPSVMGDLNKVDEQRERQKKLGSAFTRIQ
jgi:U4/U6.U5 tri-snRNP-associated protein 1